MPVDEGEYSVAVPAIRADSRPGLTQQNLTREDAEAVYSSMWFSLRELVTTRTDEKLMARAAIIGERVNPMRG